MIKQIRDIWLKGLRSDKYSQGTELLKDDEDNYCCLGVLCDLYAKEKGIDWSELNIKEEVLTKEVMAWAGLYHSNPDVTFNKTTSSLSSFNDGSLDDEHGVPMEGLTFNEIADLIEAQF